MRTYKSRAVSVLFFGSHVRVIGKYSQLTEMDGWQNGTTFLALHAEG